MVQVPLVMYVDGVRKVIGVSDVNVETGEVACIVQDKEAKIQLGPDGRYFSFISHACNLDKLAQIVYHPSSYLDTLGKDINGTLS